MGLFAATTGKDEIAHAFVFARDKTSIADHLGDSIAYDKNESKANRAAEEWGYEGSTQIRSEALALLTFRFSRHLRSWLTPGVEQV